MSHSRMTDLSNFQPSPQTTPLDLQQQDDYSSSSMPPFLSRFSAVSEAVRRFNHDALDAFQPLVASGVLSPPRKAPTSVNGRQRRVSVFTTEGMMGMESRQSGFDDIDSEGWDDSESDPSAGERVGDKEEVQRRGSVSKKLAGSLDKIVFNVERSLSSALLKIQTMVRRAVTGAEGLKAKCQDAERKEARQNEVIDDLEFQLAEAKEALEKQNKARRHVEQLEGENDELRENLKVLSQALEHRVASQDALQQKVGVVEDLQQKIKQMQRQLDKSSYRRLDTTDPSLDIFNIGEAPLETARRNFNDYITVKAKEMPDNQKLEEFLHEECFRLWCRRKPSVTEEPKVVEQQPAAAEGVDAEKMLQLEEKVDNLTLQIQVLDQERDAIAVVANRQLTAFESDIRVLIDAEIEHLYQQDPPVTILSQLGYKLSDRSHALLSDAVTHSERPTPVQPDFSASTAVESTPRLSVEGSPARKPKRLYRYRLQTYVP